MDLIVVSDLHLGPCSLERNQQFLAFLQAAFEKGDRVIIAGDLFELWFGWSHLTFSYQQPILEQMRSLVEKGLHLEYVEGNRDFGVKQQEGKIFQRVWDQGATWEVSGKKIYVEHGDLINKEDRQYRAWRKLSKNTLTYFFLQLFPAFLFLPLARRIEQRMKSTNLKYRLMYPEDHCRSFYTRHFQAGADVVVVGHFHQERERETQTAGKLMLFYNLPGWESGFRYLVIPKNGERPYFSELGR